MKIAIRRGVFETNSSSNHALMITDKDNYENDKIKFEEKMNSGFFPCHGGFAKPITDKAEKAYFLAHLFDCDKRNFNRLKKEYKIFTYVLKDNNETEILENIRLNHEKYINERSWCYCRKYYYDDILDHCTCNFEHEFNKYFNYIDVNKYLAYLLDDNAKKDFEELIKKDDRNLYEKIYDFLYNDGMIVPFEYL